MSSLIRLLQDWNSVAETGTRVGSVDPTLTCLRLGAVAGGHHHAESGCPDHPAIRFEQLVRRIISGGVPTE